MIHEELQRILGELSRAVGDAEKFDNKNNASAGRRVRKASMPAIKDLKSLRYKVMKTIHEREDDKRRD